MCRPKLRPSRSIFKRVMACRIFSNNDRPPFWILEILIFDQVTVIVVRKCCCVPNFIKIGSRIWPPDAHNCRMFKAPLLGNGRCHGNRIMRSCGICRGHDGMLPPKLGPSRSIGGRVMAFRIFCNMAAVRHFEFKKILIFDHVTIIVVLTCCRVPNFTKIGSRVQSPDAHNCWIFNALCYCRCHGNRIVGDMMGCDHPSWVSSRSIGRRVVTFWIYPTWRPSAILNFKNFNIWSRDCHCGPNLLVCANFNQNWFTRSAFRRP